MNGHGAQFNTPNIQASDAILILHSETIINAPASSVFRSLRNTETWRDWNRFVPKVNITYQPPEEDMATIAEIQEIVRNTCLAGSFYSDLTDGGVGVQKQRGPDEQPPPRFRLNSTASQSSQGSQPPRVSESIDRVAGGNQSLASHARGGSVSSTASGNAGGRSAAQKFQEAQESRRHSLANGQEPSPIVNRVESTDNHRASIAVPASPTSSSKRRGSRQSVSGGAAATKAHQALMSVYGEPSVRLQVKTKMVFYVRMKAASPSEYTQTNMVVTDVSRPDDPLLEKGTTALTRSKTHTLERSGIYRVVWATDTEGASLFNVSNIFSGTKMPKYLMQAERVHTIEPTGDESCIYRTWECQKGHAAKSVKKKYGEYLQKMFEVWANGLKEFCEGLHAPKVATRDFSISLDEPPFVMMSLT